MNLHWTFSVDTFDISSPTLFVATHWYSPLSVLLTYAIVNCLLSSEKLMRPLVFSRDPSLVHDILGTGLPVALQDNVAFSPSSKISPCG